MVLTEGTKIRTRSGQVLQSAVALSDDFVEGRTELSELVRFAVGLGLRRLRLV